MTSLTAAPSRLGTLRRPLDSFTGRKHELRELRRLLKNGRLITLFGPGGVGKSRLAVELALGRAGRYPDGVVLVELSLLAEPELLALTVASALGVAERPGADLEVTIAAALDGRRLLLVLDNCEHLTEACARFVGSLLAGCLGPQVLVTSREVLNTPGEVTFRVGPLSLPPSDGARDRESLLVSDAVRLFVERARTCSPDFDLTPDNGDLIASICHQLDGLPLAIELCASRLRLLGIHDVGALLADRFTLLDGARRTPDRHRSLHAAIEWSYQMLSPAEQATFRRLAVLAGGFDLAGATVVCADDADDDTADDADDADDDDDTAAAAAADADADAVPAGAVLNLLAALESKSLVVPVRTAPTTRFRQLETIRLFGWERLVESGELEACQQRMVGWLHGLAASEKPLALWRKEPLSLELENLQLATQWAERWADERQVTLAAILADVWASRGYRVKGRELLARVLGRGIGSAADRVNALSTAAWLEFLRADYAEAARFGELATALAEPLDDPFRKAQAHTVLGVARANLGDFAAARASLRECVALRIKAGDRTGAASALQNLAYCLVEAGDLADAAATLAEADPLIGDSSPSLRNTFRHTSGVIAVRTGDLDAAEAAFHQMVRAYAANPDEVGSVDLAYGLEGLTIVAARRGGPDRALRLAAAASVERQRLHAEAEQQWRDLVAQAVQDGRAAAEDPDGAWSEGAGWTAERAIAYVREAPEPTAVTGTNLLSEREQQVAELIAQGRTNRQIASALGISPRTVETHADHIRSKLALRSRTQIAVWAANRDDAAQT